MSFQLLINIYNDWDLLEYQLKYLRLNVNSDIPIIIVDDCSTENKLNDIDMSGLNISAYRILDRNYDWNAGGARNLGFTVANEGLVFAYDIDHTLTPKGFKTLYELSGSKERKIWRFGQYLDGKFNGYPYNIYAIQKSLFWEIGGYDEDCHSYGDDMTFHFRAEQNSSLSYTNVLSDYGQVDVVTSVSHKLEGNRSSNSISSVRTLIRRKINGEIPWSNQYLQFKWEKIK